MHSYADRYTHDFFFERDYPDVAILDEIFDSASEPKPQEKRRLQKQMLMDPEVFDKALEKLWTHGGAVVDFAENVSRGHDAWREPYLAQGEHKREQIERMIRYAESNQCRMASVVRHFGDLADGEKPCGICDYCAPATVHRAALPHRHRGGTCGAAARRSGVARGRHEIHRQALRRIVSQPVR